MKSALRCAATLVAVCIGSMAVTDRTAHAQGSGARNLVLDEGGVMNGQVRNGSGQPVSSVRVSVSQGGRQVAVTQTDAQGMFSIGGLREGDHVVSACNRATAYRFWSQSSAPAGADSFAELLCVPEEVAYSQPSRPQPVARRGGFLRRSFANYPVLTTAALLGAGIGSGIAIGSSGGGSTPASP